MSVSTRADMYQRVTDSVIAALERGTAPWVHPVRAYRPINGNTGKAYRGINVLLLVAEAQRKRYCDTRWFTFKQVQLCGGSVRKGEKSQQIIFWKPLKRSEGQDDGEATEETKQFVAPRSYCVFNAEQCDGIELQRETLEQDESNARYKAAGDLIERHSIRILKGPQPAYTPRLDAITMPEPAEFVRSELYWSTLLHEVTHWTGHSSRLKRDLDGRFGSESYAAEELVAELGSAFLCSALGIQGQLQHPQYIDNWLRVLRGDKRAIFAAAGLAQKAVDFLLSEEQDQAQPAEVRYAISA